MDQAIDGVLLGLVALAEQGQRVEIAIQVDGAVIAGILMRAAAYREELAKLIGQPVRAPDIAESDRSFLHLYGANLRGSGDNSAPYRCRLSAVQGYVVLGS